MEVSTLNNVKIYNLSGGKSLPEWLSEKKRRSALKKDVGLRNRIELLQDFQMPVVSSCIRASKDGQYLLATGTYKPRVRCYDVNHLSMKFERCFDSEVVTFEILSDDYSKAVFLHFDRYAEFHSQYGKYHRIRIPRFGRDMAYHYPSCDLYFVGASNEVWRFNLEQGQFLNSLVTDAMELNTCTFNPHHYLFVCGTESGRVEAWDPRVRRRVGILDCALSSVSSDTELTDVPSITALKFRDPLMLGVGTSTGQILLYDIRSDQPLLIKDHMYGLPIKNVDFQASDDLVFSMDSKVLKIWNRNTGKPYTAIEGKADLNDLCVIPSTGMLFLANEDRKMLTYYIPSIGPAPRWCSFLDSLTEEMEETNVETIYDNYKFVTTTELDELGLSNLIGSNLLRAYMHGYFMDARLYRKAKSVIEPFVYEDYQKKKIREKIEEKRENRVQLNKLPKVNPDLALKLMDEEVSEDKKMKKKKKLQGQSLLKDDRFKQLFENPDFKVDKEHEAYRMLNPVLSRLDKDREIKLQQEVLDNASGDKNEEEEEGLASSDESEESSDDEGNWKEVKRQHWLLKNEQKMRQRQEDHQARLQPSFYEIKSGEEFGGKHPSRKQKLLNVPLSERLSEQTDVASTAGYMGNKELVFSLKKPSRESSSIQAAKAHKEERRKIQRTAGHLLKKMKSRRFKKR